MSPMPGSTVLSRSTTPGALAPIDYASWKYTDPNDIPKEYMTPTTVGLCLYATVLGYNKETFPEGKQPKSWAEFWDAEKFPGARMLADMASGTPNLEFALIADGVPMDKVFPIDIDRAFKSLSRIKPHIKKFWDTGALSAQMLADKDVVLGSIWNGRLQAIADKGAPVAIEWNQHMLADPGLRHLQGRQEHEGGAALPRLRDEPEGAARPRQGAELRPDQPQIVRPAAARTGRQAARQPGAAEAQLPAGCRLVGREPRQGQSIWSKWILS